MEPPPSYEQAQAQSTGASNRTNNSTLHVPRNGIPPASRRSMEDEFRPLPQGWIRQYDQKEHHQFFVDTKATPPRSIWHHPYDDDQYLNTLSSEERERIQELHRTPTAADLEAESTDDEDGHSARIPTASAGASLPPRPSNSSTKKETFGRRMKDKMTNSTHEEREEKRRQRAVEEQKAYEAHMAFRRALSRAMETGQPQFLAKDRDGRDVYVEPPAGPGPGYGGYGPRGYGYNPYRQGPYSSPQTSAVYSDPNARIIRPNYPYQRPYGGGYGGGMGMPMMGGLMGGMLLGGLLF